MGWCTRAEPNCGHVTVHNPTDGAQPHRWGTAHKLYTANRCILWLYKLHLDKMAKNVFKPHSHPLPHSATLPLNFQNPQRSVREKRAWGSSVELSPTLSPGPWRCHHKGAQTRCTMDNSVEGPQKAKNRTATPPINPTPRNYWSYP